jgi:hypothetical protein
MTFGAIVRAPLPSPMPRAVLPSPGCAVALLLSPSVAGRRAVVALDRCLAIHAAGRGGDTSRALGFRHRTIPVRRTCYLSTCWGVLWLGGGRSLLTSHLRFAAGVCVLTAGLLMGGGAVAVADPDSSGSAAKGTDSNQQHSTGAKKPKKDPGGTDTNQRSSTGATSPNQEPGDTDTNDEKKDSALVAAVPNVVPPAADVVAPVADVVAPVPNLVAPTSDVIAFLQDMCQCGHPAHPAAV